MGNKLLLVCCILEIFMSLVPKAYHLVPKFSEAKKLCCNLPKNSNRGQTLGYFVKMMQME